MTLPEALEHSVPQLRLLSRAAVRVRSGQGLLDLRVTVAGTCAGFGNGGRPMEKLQRELKKNL